MTSCGMSQHFRGMLGNFYWTTCHYMLHHTLHSHRCENLKSNVREKDLVKIMLMHLHIIGPQLLTQTVVCVCGARLVIRKCCLLSGYPGHLVRQWFFMVICSEWGEGC
jgi:hypothetical protein